MLNIKDQILTFLRTKEDPIKLKSILKNLGLGIKDRQYVRDVMSQLVKEALVTKTGNRFWVPEGKKLSREIKREKTRQSHEMVGRLSITSHGYGFVTAAEGQDWLIPEDYMTNAGSGDLVRVRKVKVKPNGRVIGEIVAVEKFGNTAVVGVFQIVDLRAEFLPFEKFELDRKQLVGFPKDVKHGQVGYWVRREDGKWNFGGVLGMISDPAVDEAIVLKENDITASFSEEVLAEAEGFSSDFPFELGDRRDFRGERVFTVDGAGARDFDDALHFKTLASGEVEVGIHIADVAEFVKPDSVLDRWAQQQGNSVYLPHRAYPMLPPVLSNLLCSLMPRVLRYTLSVICRLSSGGELNGFSLHKGLIQSSYRLTYEDVVAIGIQKDEKVRETYAPLVDSIDLGLSLARNMRRIRIQRGSLDLDLSETRIHLDAEQNFLEAQEYRQTDANRMIEAFMCLANECVATYMNETGIGVPYRIHDWPDPQRLETLGLFLKSTGYEPPVNLQEQPGVAMNRIIEDLKHRSDGQVIQTQLLKSLKLAEYLPENRGHFGLASTHYAHFTSPIRRYADLFIHQRLTLLLKNKDLAPEHFDDSQLPAICGRISQKEREAARAEQSFVQLKLLRFLTQKLGDSFDGIIVEAKSFGLFVRLAEFPISGLVHVDELGGDLFIFVPEMLSLVGRRSYLQYRVGMEVKVQLTRVDVISRRIDLKLLEGGVVTGSLKEIIQKLKEPPKSPRGRAASRGGLHAGPKSGRPSKPRTLAGLRKMHSKGKGNRGRR